MKQENRREFEKLNSRDQEWGMEVLRLLGSLTEDQQQAALGLARTLAACNTLQRTSADGRLVQP